MLSYFHRSPMGLWQASQSASTFVSSGAFGILFSIPDRLRALRLCFLMFVWVYVFGCVSANVLDYCHRLSFTLMLYLLYLQWLLSVMHGVGYSWGVVCIRWFVCALGVLCELVSLSIGARNRCQFRYHSLTSSHINAGRCVLGYHGFRAKIHNINCIQN